MVRAPFDMTSMDTLFKIIYPYEIIDAMGTVKIRQKNFYDGSFFFQSPSSGRFFYHFILIHVLNYFGLLYVSVVSMESCSGVAGEQASLNRYIIVLSDDTDNKSPIVESYDTHTEAK